MNGNIPVSRRAFVGGGLAAMAAAALRVRGEESAARWRMRLSTSTVQFGSLSVEKACEQIAALGVEAVDFWAIFGCTHIQDIDQRLGAAGLKDILAKNKLKLCAFSCYGVGYPKYAKLLGDCGGGVAIRDSRGGKKDLVAEMKAFMESLKPQIELAEKYDSYLAIENHGEALLDSLDSFKAFVEMNRSERVGIALAPYHLQAGKISVEETIRVCGRQLLFFYAWQHQAGMGQLPGIGTTDFTPWLRALAEIRYSRYVNPFMHNHPEPKEMAEGLTKSRDYLKACHAKL